MQSHYEGDEENSDSPDKTQILIIKCNDYNTSEQYIILYRIVIKISKIKFIKHCISAGITLFDCLLKVSPVLMFKLNG